MGFRELTRWSSRITAHASSWQTYVGETLTKVYSSSSHVCFRGRSEGTKILLTQSVLSCWKILYTKAVELLNLWSTSKASTSHLGLDKQVITTLCPCISPYLSKPHLCAMRLFRARIPDIIAAAQR